jgi:2Fe-2S ferredoxin
MIGVTFIDRDGIRREVQAEGGVSLMEAGIYNDVEGLVAECGGVCSCATCHVYVAEEWLSRLAPASADERDLLELAKEVRPGSRLSCQVRLSEALDGMTVEVADNEID